MEWPQRSVVSLCLLLLAACGGGSSSSDNSKPSAAASDLEVPSWSRPADPMSLAREAGLMPDTKEYLTYHVHAHLDVFVNGHPVEIPAGIGIEITDPAVEKFGSGYGGIPEEGCEQVCISPLHTHDPDGVIHIEGAVRGPIHTRPVLRGAGCSTRRLVRGRVLHAGRPRNGRRRRATPVGEPC